MTLLGSKEQPELVPSLGGDSISESDTFQKEIWFGRTGSCFCFSPQGRGSSESAIASTCVLLLRGGVRLGFVGAGAGGSAESSSLPRRASAQEPVLPGRVAAALQTLP